VAAYVPRSSHHQCCHSVERGSHKRRRRRGRREADICRAVERREQYRLCLDRDYAGVPHGLEFPRAVQVQATALTLPVPAACFGLLAGLHDCEIAH